MATSSALLTAIVCIVAVILIACIVLFIRSRSRSSAHSSDEYINEQVYVGNLPYRVSEDDLREYFSRYGETQSVRIIRDFKTGRSKGYAFVTYLSSDHANAALAAHGQDMRGRSMVVRIAKPRQSQEFI